jgi:uncharacterized protein
MMERIGAKPGQRDRWRTGRSVLDLYRDLAQARFGQALVRIVLFGSRARGDNQPESDWDVAVFLSGEVTPGDQRQVSAIGHDVMCETGALIRRPAVRALAGRRRARPAHPSRGRSGLWMTLRRACASPSALPAWR